MDVTILEAEPREVTGKKVKALRRAGLVPAVMYGKDVDPTAIQLDDKETDKLLSQAGASTLIDLKIGKKTHKVLFRAVQRDPITQQLLHVDLLQVAMDVAIRTYIPIELVGEAPAVKNLGGVLVSGLSEIEVEALPSDLIDRITVDLEVLQEMDASITVADLFAGKDVTVLTDPEELVARIVYQIAEEVEEEVVERLEEVLQEGEPEVIGREEAEQADGAEG